MPRLLDLYCKAGGATRGYQLAGFEVVGVDYEPQPRYVGEHFVLGNAIAALDVLLCGGAITDTSGREWRLSDFDAIHASPPCQGYSIMRNLPWLRHKVYPLLIEPTRELLEAAGLPYVIENVAGARYGKNMTALGLEAHGLKAGFLCGQMFGIPILRHRYFETNWPWMAPGHGKHWGTVRNGREHGHRARDIVTLPDGRVRTKTTKAGLPAVEPERVPYSDAEDARGIESWPNRRGSEAGSGLQTYFQQNGARSSGVAIGHAAGVNLARAAMQIDWMTRDELTQAIPPIMTQYIGAALLVEIEHRKSAR